MSKLFLSLVIYFSLILISFADHGPKKMWKRQILPYFDVHETKMMGPFKINVHAYGEKKKLDTDNLKKENFSSYSKEILINEILDCNSIKKYNVIKLGDIKQNELDNFFNIFSNKKGFKFELQNSLTEDESDTPFIILTKLGSVTSKELNSLKNRIKLSKKLIKGIILI